MAMTRLDAAGSLGVLGAVLLHLNPQAGEESDVTYLDGRLTYQAKNAATEALREVRNQQVTGWLTSEASAGVEDDALWPMLMHTLIARLHHIDPNTVAKALGLEVVWQDDKQRYVNREATADKWLEDCSPAQCRQVLLGLLLTQGVFAMGHLDGIREPDADELDEEEATSIEQDYRPIVQLLVGMVPTVQSVLSHDELVKVATRAMAKLEDLSDDAEADAEE